MLEDFQNQVFPSVLSLFRKHFIVIFMHIPVISILSILVAPLNRGVENLHVDYRVDIRRSLRDRTAKARRLSEVLRSSQYP